MESEIRAILAEAVSEPGDRDGLFATILDRFAQVLPFDSRAAKHYAEVVGGRDQIGLPIDGFDGQIASICHAHGATLATRDLRDFRHTDVTLIDPWQRP